AWAFVRFGVEVPAAVARGIAEETVKRRPELYEEPGDAVLLSDAVCSEWGQHVPKALYDECDAIGREQYDMVRAFFEDWSNIPSMSCSVGEAERYQEKVTGFKIIQLGRRLSYEILRRFGILEENQELVLPLRRMRESWLLKELEGIDPTDATMQHKTTCTWKLSVGQGQEGEPEDGASVLASGSPMGAEVRFVSCVVEHPRASDAEFQVVNKAAERLLQAQAGSASPVSATLRFDVSEIPCLSCLGALRQFQKSFPAVKLCGSFNIRKVSDVCRDRSVDAHLAELPPPPRQPTDLPPPSPQDVLDNRGRGRAQGQQPNNNSSSWSPLGTKLRDLYYTIPVEPAAQAPPLWPPQPGALAFLSCEELELQADETDLDMFFASQARKKLEPNSGRSTQSFY
ncbi:unnamed protein product, partial [Polarella glacialis]